MLIRLLQPCRFPDKHGRSRLHYIGDVVDVKNKAMVQKLIKQRRAVDMAAEAKGLPKGVGVLARGATVLAPWVRALNVEVATGGLGLPFAYTLIWDGKVKPRPEFLVVTFEVLARTDWEVAVPLYSYDKLAVSMGTAEERARTKKLIHDVRVPTYRSELLFVQRNERTEKLIAAWKREMANGADERLAFMRAVYRIKPYLLPLPCMWIAKR